MNALLKTDLEFLDFTDEEVQDTNSLFNFKVKIISNKVIITGSNTEWYIDRPYTKAYRLYHKNDKFNTDVYHYHDTFKSLGSAMASIKKHNNHVVVRREKMSGGLSNAFALIEQERNRKTK